PGKFRGIHGAPRRDSRALPGARQMDRSRNAGSFAAPRTDATRTGVLRTRGRKVAEKIARAHRPRQICSLSEAPEDCAPHKKEISRRKALALSQRPSFQTGASSEMLSMPPQLLSKPCVRLP